MVAETDIRQVPDDEVDGEEERVRVTDEDQIRGVDALRRDTDSWPWTVFISVAEFVRHQPLEGDLDKGVTEALMAVAGVTDVIRDDREVWIVEGAPSGPDLVRAAALVVDSLAPRCRAYIDHRIRGSSS
jgi:hypothetical protein